VRRISFDYPNTCPKVDKHISGAESVIRTFVEGLLEEACPLLSSRSISDLSDERAKNLYSDLEPIFEGVRESNSEMRSEAERQIEDLQERIADLEAQVDQLERSAA
jgi:DNA repair exonuclease SbcCD ATPase subunit